MTNKPVTPTVTHTYRRIVQRAGRQRGFTLIELVIGIVVLAVALTLITSAFLPQANKAKTPMYQVRATELAESMMDDILIRYYDAVNVSRASYQPCGDGSSDNSGVACTLAADFGPELGEHKSQPQQFNDVDDYQIYCNLNNDGSVNSSYDPKAALAFFTSAYPQYGVRICVTDSGAKFASASAAAATSPDIAKRIVLQLFMPDGDAVTLTAFKGNY